MQLELGKINCYNYKKKNRGENMKIAKKITALALAFIIMLTACDDKNSSSDLKTNEQTKATYDLDYDFEDFDKDEESVDRTKTFTPYEKMSDGPKYEEAKFVDKSNNIEFERIFKAEDLNIKADSKIITVDNEKVVQVGANATISVAVDIPQSGNYSVEFVWKTEQYTKPMVVFAGQKVSPEVSPSDVFITYGIYNVNVESEKLVARLTSVGHDKMQLKEIRIFSAQKISQETYNVSAELSNKNATDNTKRLMKFIADNYGKNVLTGQTSNNAMASQEFQKIYNTTGRYPAVCGFDLIEYSPSRKARGSYSNAVDNAIRWYQVENGIVEFAWHWNAPEKYLYDTGSDYTGEQKWWKGFYTEATSISIKDIMEGRDEEGYQLLLDDIDAIAVQLKILQNYDVPVLWRPLHEASGGWFWWGAEGAEPYKALWRLLYDRLTNYHKLNNLIWVYNGQNPAWYPGDDVVDIIGEDIYPEKKDVSPQQSRFKQALSSTESKKIIALTENGNIPDIDMLLEEKVMWSWFCTWEGDFVLDKKSDTVSTEYTPQDIVIKAYNHENTITLDELPDLKTYSLD